MLGIPLACRHSSRQKVYKDGTRTLLLRDKLPIESTYSTSTASLSCTTGGEPHGENKKLDLSSSKALVIHAKRSAGRRVDASDDTKVTPCCPGKMP